MRRFLMLVLLCITTAAKAQLVDDFSDGNFTANPIWTGDTSLFVVNPNAELQLNSLAATQSAQLRTANTLSNNVQWTFWVKLDFSPSGSNRLRVYLISDSEELTAELNGYFIQIGESGSDDGVDLYRQDGSTTTRLIDGRDATMSASSNEARIRITRSGSGSWILEVDESGGDTFTLEGTAQDDSHTNTAFFGLVCDHTSTRRDRFFFDDLRISEAAIDLVSAEAINSNTVDVGFSKAINPASVSASHFQITPDIGQPTSATLQPDQQTIRLSLSTSLKTNTYTLLANNIQSADGSETIPTNSQTTFGFVRPVAPGSVLITEIFADPNPAVGLPEGEFVELYNASSEAVQLENFVFADASGEISLAALRLQPGQYLILCNRADTTAFQAFGVTQGVSLPALNNDEDDLSIRDPQGNVVDAVSYSDDWYADPEKEDGGWSLERISLNDACLAGAANWMASTANAGGTPGQPNAVLDNSLGGTNPLITDVDSISSTRLVVQFSKVMDEASLLAANYAISGGVSVSAVLPAGDLRSVSLTLSGLSEGQTYELTLTGATDCEGRPLLPIPINFGLGGAAAAFDILITEIMADPSPVVALPEVEYLEIYNTTTELIDLDGFVIRDGTSEGIFPPVSIPGSSYAILCDDDDVSLFGNDGIVIGIASMPALNNTGETLTLLNEKGEYVFDVSYDDDWHTTDVQKDGGYSLEMLDLESPCAGAENWQSSRDPFGGTPGRPNSQTASFNDTRAPRLINAVPTQPQLLRLRFDEKLGSWQADEVEVSLDQPPAIDSIYQDPASASQVFAQLSAPLSIGVEYEVTVSGFADCIGNISEERQSQLFALPEQGDSADILLNEILFNPPSGGVDFVEIRNISDRYISLRNWQLANSEEGLIANPEAISTDFLTLAPGAYLALTEDTAQLAIQYPNAPRENFIQTDLPSYNDEQGSAVLLDSSGRLMDRFDYSEDYHLSLLDDEEGVSLERIAANAATNDPNNWKSASATSGFGTPGAPNSQNLENPAITRQKDCFSVAPAVFTPDMDGMDDFTLIRYTCGQPDLIANITIYNQDGVPVRTLLRNQTLSTIGSLQWDGTNDAGARVRLGLYLFFIETFTPNGEVNAYKLPIAVGSRR